MTNVTLLGIDIAKNVFQLHGVDEKGNAVLTRRLTREKFVEFVAKLPSCMIWKHVVEQTIGIENLQP